MRALVTGGGGFLGRYIVEQLRARGDEVRVLCRGDYPELAALGVELVRGDVRDAVAVARACAGRDIVFHTAAIAGIWGQKGEYFAINTRGTAHVIAGCHLAGVERLVHTSSPSVIYDGTGPQGVNHEGADESLPYPSSYLCAYPESKAHAERLVLEANGTNGLSTCALRPHLIWGPRDNHLFPRLIARAKSGRLRRVGPGTNRISTVHVATAAAAHLQAADRLSPGSHVAGNAYFVNDKQPVAMWPWIDRILELAGLPPVRKRIGLAAAYRAGAVLEGVYRVLGLRSEPPMTRFLALQLGTSHFYTTARAERDFGFHPVVDPDAALEEMRDELRSLR